MDKRIFIDSKRIHEVELCCYTFDWRVLITNGISEVILFYELTVSQLIKDFSIIHGNRSFTDLTRFLTIESNFCPAESSSHLQNLSLNFRHRASSI